MADACYTVRATTHEQVTAYIKKLDLPLTNNNYQYENAVKLVANARRVLTPIYNPAASNITGMSKLLDTDSDVSAIKSTDIATINSITKKSKARAKQKSTTNNVAPHAITTWQDAQDEADHANWLPKSSWDPKKASRRPSLPKWAAPSPTPSYALPTAATTKGLTNTTWPTSLPPSYKVPTAHTVVTSSPYYRTSSTTDSTFNKKLVTNVK